MTSSNKPNVPGRWDADEILITVIVVGGLATVVLASIFYPWLSTL